MTRSRNTKKKQARRQLDRANGMRRKRDREEDIDDHQEINIAEAMFDDDQNSREEEYKM